MHRFDVLQMLCGFVHTGHARMNRMRKDELPSLMKRCVSLEKQTCFAQELSMNSTSSSLMKRCVGYFIFAFLVLRSVAFRQSPALVSMFWSMGPSNLLKENANVELKRGSKHNLYRGILRVLVKKLLNLISFPAFQFRGNKNLRFYGNREE